MRTAQVRMIAIIQGHLTRRDYYSHRSRGCLAMHLWARPDARSCHEPLRFILAMTGEAPEAFFCGVGDRSDRSLQGRGVFTVRRSPWIVPV